MRRSPRQPEGSGDRDDHDDDFDVDADLDVDDEHAESDQAYCPDCGALIWDQADICPKCFSYLAGNTSRHPPRRALSKSSLRRVVALVLIAAIVVGTCAYGIFLLRRILG